MKHFLPKLVMCAWGGSLKRCTAFSIVIISSSNAVNISWDLVIIYERMFYSMVLSVSSIVPPNLIYAIWI
jgi:hypothetical protein